MTIGCDDISLIGCGGVWVKEGVNWSGFRLNGSSVCARICSSIEGWTDGDTFGEEKGEGMGQGVNLQRLVRDP